MRRVKRRAKRVHKIKFADGQIFTIVDIEPNPQTGDVTLFLRGSVGTEFLIIPLLLAIGAVAGYAAFGMTGVFIGVCVSGVCGFLIINQTSMSSKPKTLTIPEGSIIGFDSYYQLKNSKYVFCCHSFDSMGNSIVSGSDPLSLMENRLRSKDQLIKHMRGQISTLNYRITESQMGHKELVDTVSAQLEKIIRSTVTPTKARPMVQYPSAGIPPESFIMPEKELEG